jgi:hypothetical protein
MGWSDAHLVACARYFGFRSNSNMTTLRSRLIRLAAARPALRPHLLPLLRRAGYSYPVEDLYLVLVEKPRGTIVNVDFFKALRSIYVDAITDDGTSHPVAPEFVNAYYGMPLAHAEEMMGVRKEVVVWLRVARGTRQAVVSAIRKMFKRKFEEISTLATFRQPVNRRPPL